MHEPKNTPVETDGWAQLRTYTDARIALGKTGVSVPMRASLAFRLAHAHAKDAVYSAINVAELQQALTTTGLEIITVRSQANNRDSYLQRPDLGRQLSPESETRLRQKNHSVADVCLVVADGLSATAVMEHAGSVVQLLVEKSRQTRLSLTPVVLVEQGRVAVADAIGSLLNARLVVILLGERPGLSSPDSLGAYLTFAPCPGLTDERRNCVSNIRPEGFPPGRAAEKIMYLIQTALHRQRSGIDLKDEHDGLPSDDDTRRIE